MHEDVRGAARRVLAIAVPLDAPLGSASIGPAAALAPDGILIVMEGDVSRADEARRVLSAHGLSARASVIGGDPRRMLYKLAGPFDVIFCGAAYLSSRDLLERLLAPNGVLITDGPD